MSAVVFLVAIAILPNLLTLATTPRWAILALTVPFIWYFTPGRVTWGHVLGASFLAGAAGSLTWTMNPEVSLYELGKLALLGLLFCIGAGRRSLTAVYVAAALGAGVNSVLMIGQSFGWDILPQATKPAGTFYNKNFAAEFCALALVGALGLPGRWKWLAVLALPGVLLGQSKTAFLALGCAGILLVWQINKQIAALIVLLTVAAGTYFVFSGYTFIQRIQLWQDTWDGMTFFGRGVGSFWATFPEHATRIDALSIRPSEAHNDLLQLWYELGPLSLVAVALLVFAWRGPKRAEHYVLLVFLVEGLAGFPLHLPATAMLAALVLGRLCGDRPELQLADTWRRIRGVPGEDAGAHDGRGDPALGPCAGAVPVRP